MIFFASGGTEQRNGSKTRQGRERRGKKGLGRKEVADLVHNLVPLDMIEGFEWDDDKQQSNIAERGVDFRLASQIFQNPVIENEDKREEYGEQRFRALGYIGDEYFIVAYTWLSQDYQRVEGRRRWQEKIQGNTHWTT